MPYFRKKPVTVEAHQLPPAGEDATEELMEFLADATYVWEDSMTIATLEGDMIASPKDWIIKGVAGEFYPCKPDIFEATYDSEEQTTGKKWGI